MIVTIDGPAGAGKSTIARALARRLGFRFLDTGAMYRAVAPAAIRRDLGWDDPRKLVELAGALRLEVTENSVEIDGQDVTAEIRTSDVTAATHHAANNAGVREHLVGLQRKAAGRDDIVTEGRDQGTVRLSASRMQNLSDCQPRGTGPPPCPGIERSRRADLVR